MSLNEFVKENPNFNKFILRKLANHKHQAQ